MTRGSISKVLFCLLAMRGAGAQQLETSQAVNVHDGPSTASAVTMALDSGVVVSLLSRRNGYDHVELADHTRGWIYGRLVSPASARNARAPTAVRTVVADVAGIAALPKRDPKEADDARCSDIGAGRRPGAPVDTATNLLKNRVDEGEYRDVSFAAVLALPGQGLARNRNKWVPTVRAATARYELAAVALTGYVVAVKLEGAETTNCEQPDADWRDWHLWLVATAEEAATRDRTRAVVVEVTPRVRALHPGALDIRQIGAWSRAGTRVRISGWLMLDPEHPDEVGRTRGTIWEIHPVMDIEPAP